MSLPSLDDIKERKLVQWVLAYLGVAWLILQVMVALGGVYGWPGWLLRAVPVVLIVGFFVALALAWYHGEQGRQRVGGVELGILTALFALAGLGVALIGPGGEDSVAENDPSIVETTDLDNLSTDQALELAYDWGTSGNVGASTDVLDYLIQRAESDSARMSFLALGASLLSRNERPDESVAWIVRLMDIDPLALALSSDARPEITREYLEAMRRHYAGNSQPGPVRDIAVLPQNAYMVGFPDSLSQLGQDVGGAVSSLLTSGLAEALRPTSIGVLERASSDLFKNTPLPIETISVGLPGSDWLWIDDSSMQDSFLRASHYVLSYCTYLGEPFDPDGGASMTCNARLISTEGAGVRASAQSRGDIANFLEMTDEICGELAEQIADGLEPFSKPP